MAGRSPGLFPSHALHLLHFLGSGEQHSLSASENQVSSWTTQNWELWLLRTVISRTGLQARLRAPPGAQSQARLWTVRHPQGVCFRCLFREQRVPRG